jgi:hypothetical protein
MANNAKVMDSIKSFLLKMKANDENIPEELAQDACEMVEAVKDALCEDEEVIEEKKEEEVKDEDPKEDIDKKVEDAMVNVMRKYGLIKDGAMTSLDELEKKLGEEETEDVDGEEKVTEDPEKINDSARRQLLKQVKPIIAGVKDSAQRKALADAFAKSLGMNKQTADYSAVLSASRSAVKDSKIKNPNPVSDADFGMEIARKYNPHYMKEDK